MCVCVLVCIQMRRAYYDAIERNTLDIHNNVKTVLMCPSGMCPNGICGHIPRNPGL